MATKNKKLHVWIADDETNEMLQDLGYWITNSVPRLVESLENEIPEEIEWFASLRYKWEVEPQKAYLSRQEEQNA